MGRMVARWLVCVLVVGAFACGGDGGSPGSSSTATRSVPSAPSTSSVSSTASGSTGSTRTRLDGTISNLAGTCPSLTFSVNGTGVSTSVNTQFVGQTCAQLTNGTNLFVRGTLQNGTVVADEVRAEVETAPAHAHGTVSALQGTCPSVTLTVNGTNVSTSASTKFVGGTCAQVANGVTVGVEGALQNGVLVATEVRVNLAATDLHGTVSGLQGTCPTLTFTLQSTTVSTSASTRFIDGSCQQMKNGSGVSAEGTLQNGSLVAERVLLHD